MKREMCGKFPRWKLRLCSDGAETKKTKDCTNPSQFSGDNGERDPPVPIPNTEVKPFSADGTWLETTWESRTLPDSTKKSLRRCLGLFLCGSRQVLLPGRFQANVQHCTWLGSPMCAASGGSSTWGKNWESRTLPDSMKRKTCP